MDTKILQEKEWDEHDIHQAHRILDRASIHDLFLSKIVFWSALIVVIFANILVSFVLIPFLIVLNSYVLYGLVALMGLVIGFLYNFLIQDIGLLEKKHHRIATLLVPLIALGNMVLMVYISNRFITDLLVNNPLHNPWSVSVIFVVAFLLPYVVDEVRIALKK